jgi:thioredoxin 1
MIAPRLDELAQQFADRVQFYKVDVDQEQTLASQQGITAMPTLKIFKDGKEIQTIV